MREREDGVGMSTVFCLVERGKGLTKFSVHVSGPSVTVRLIQSGVNAAPPQALRQAH